MSDFHSLTPELADLLEALCLGEIGPEQAARLEKLIAEDREARRHYVRFISMHAMAERVEAADPTREALALELAVQAALRADAHLPTPLPSAGMRRGGKRYGDRRLRFNMTLGAVLSLLFAGAVAGTGAILSSILLRNAAAPQAAQNPPFPPGEGQGAAATPVAHLARAVDCVWSNSLPGAAGQPLAGRVVAGDGQGVRAVAAPKAGDALLAGRKLVLKSGLAEIVFENGAHAILEGPAVIDIRSRAAAGLTRGKLAITADKPSARGFEINTPGMKYTDLGTEFGVWVAEIGEQEVHVFRGRVQAEQEREESEKARKQDGDATMSRRQDAPPLVLSAHEAIRIAAPDKPIQHISADEKRFVRAILDPFPIFSTGVGLDGGAKDPHWEIIAVSTEPKFKPQQAVVAVPMEFYAPVARDKAQWIADSTILRNMPDGCRWTFRTKFDLKGFDPSTARIEGRFFVDDYLVEFRLNGKRLPQPEGARDDGRYKRPTHLLIAEGFVPGVNTLELVVENAAATSSPNCMALCVDWKGTARRAEERKSKRE